MKNLLIFVAFVVFTLQIKTQPAVLTPNIGHASWAYVLALSPNEKYFASGSSDFSVILWSIETERVIRQFTGHSGLVNSVCFSPDGLSILSGSSDGTAIYSDVLTGKTKLVIKSNSKKVMSVGISPDNKTAIYGTDDGKVNMVSLETGAVVYALDGHRFTVWSSVFSADGKMALTASGDSTAIVWETETGKKLLSLKGHKHGIKQACFSANDQLIATASWDSTLKIWNAKTGTIVKTLRGHKSRVDFVSFVNNDKTLVSRAGEYAETKNDMRVWDFATGKCIRIQPISGEELSGIYLFKNADFLLLSFGKSVNLYDFKKFVIVKSFESKGCGASSVVYSHGNANFIFSSHENKIKYWDINYAKQFFTLNAFGHVFDMDISNDNTYLLTGGLGPFQRNYSFKNLGLFNINSRQRFDDSLQCYGSVFQVQFLPDSNQIAVANDYVLHMSVPDGKLLRAFKNHAYPVSALCYLPNGKQFLSGSWDKTMKLVDIQNNKVDLTFYGHTGWITEICTTSDGKTAVSCSHDNTLISWDLTTGNVKKIFRGHTNYVRACILSPDEKFVISASSDNSIRFWDMNSGTEIKKLTGHFSEILDLDISANKKFLVSASGDGTVRFWNLETGKEIIMLLASLNTDQWIAITPDGYWDGSPDCSNLISMVLGMNVFSIEQFAIKNNRPDLILERLGSADQDLINHYNYRYKKRLQKLNLSAEQLDSSLHVPVSKITNIVQQAKLLTLNIELSDSVFQLKTYHVFVNNVPVYGAIGKSTSGNTQKVTEIIELTTGTNKIEVSCINEKGTESYRALTSVLYEKPTISNLYYLGFGVSTYENAQLNLSYAHKDALDLEQVFLKMKGRKYTEVFTKILINEQVTIENIKKAGDFLKNAKPDDVFVLFIAGHGMHDTDENATYYYLTYNTKLDRLSETAANFELIESLLQGIAPRNKLFLMDACESGEIDEEQSVQYLATAGSRGLKSRGFIPTNQQQIAPKRSYLHQKDRYIYNDLLRRSGAIVFSSSKGGELSYEYSDLENGLYTEFIIKALTTQEADSDKNGVVSIDELRTYVTAQVAKASVEAQHPTVDRDNLFVKFGFGIK